MLGTEKAKNEDVKEEDSDNPWYCLVLNMADDLNYLAVFMLEALGLGSWTRDTHPVQRRKNGLRKYVHCLLLGSGNRYKVFSLVGRSMHVVFSLD